MAIKPVSNESFYREVDEELRREQMSNAWRRFRVPIVAGVVLLLLAVAGVLYWNHRNEQLAGEQGEKLIGLLERVEAGDTRQALPQVEAMATSDNQGYRAAALLTKAGIASRAGDAAAAAAAFKAVAEDDGLARPYRDLALIRQTATEFDKLPPATVVARLGSHAKPGNPWFGSAGEMVAIAHLRQNKPKLAAPIFAAMAKDEKLPPSLRARAVQMAGALGVDAIQPSEGTGEAAASKEVSE